MSDKAEIATLLLKMETSESQQFLKTVGNVLTIVYLVPIFEQGNMLMVDLPQKTHYLLRS